MNSVLIVDDDQNVRITLEYILLEEGFECVTAESGEKALEVINEKTFDVILLDIVMGEISGIDFLEKTKDRLPDTAIIVLTGIESRELGQEAMHHGIFSYLIKPFSNTEVIINVSNAIEKLELEKNNRVYRDSLEQKVEERTKELKESYEELKRSQSLVVQQEKFASLGLLSAGIAHEISTPVAYVMSNMSTLSKYFSMFNNVWEQCADSDFAEEFKKLASYGKLVKIIDDVEPLISEVRDGCERIKAIAQDLRTFSRTAEDSPVPAQLNQIVEQALNICRNELKYKVSINKSLSAELPEITCYPQKLCQVMINLLVNASQAIKDQGEISIFSYEEDDKVCLRIEDNGCGIDAEHLAKIFDPFFTTKEVGKGTGLGLYICQTIVRQHGGQLIVKSQKGKGSSFTLELPAKML